jgi:hypothetical protein
MGLAENVTEDAHAFVLTTRVSTMAQSNDPLHRLNINLLPPFSGRNREIAKPSRTEAIDLLLLGSLQSALILRYRQ